MYVLPASCFIVPLYKTRASGLLSTMPHTSKKQRLDYHQGEAVAAGNDFSASFDDLGVDELANIFAFLPVKREVGFLSLKDIMSKRRINKKSREAVKMTIVPPTDFFVYSMRQYNAMRAIARAMSNLQKIDIGSIRPHKFNDGEDPNEREREREAETAHRRSLDISIISNFSKLRILELFRPELNGRYPFLFNSFPLLQILRIRSCDNLKWDLAMLAGFPVLKEFHSDANYHLTGNIISLRVIKDTLEKVNIRWCSRVEGNFMDLADFPRLKELKLGKTAVTGDIRDIGENDFSSLEQITLPEGVYGGKGYELQRISDAPELMRAVYLLRKQRPTLRMRYWSQDWRANLSEDSPDWYESVDEDILTPPFSIRFVEAGSRIGYRWEGDYDNLCTSCEVNWLDPVPESGGIGYEDCLADYNRIQGEIGPYRGYYEPPSEEEYTLLYEEYLAEIQRDDEGH